MNKIKTIPKIIEFYEGMDKSELEWQKLCKKFDIDMKELKQTILKMMGVKDKYLK